MTEDLKKLILKAADVLQSFGADEVFFFSSTVKVPASHESLLELAVSGLPADAFFPAMGAMMSVVKRPCRLVDLDEQNPYTAYLKSHGKMQPDLAIRVRNELDQLHSLLASYRPLLDRAATGNPGANDCMALAEVLLLLYSGYDRIFRLLLRKYHGNPNKKLLSDAEVLEWMAMPAPGRSSVISRMLMELLLPYMSFRQFMHSTFSIRLDWEKMRSLVIEAGEIQLLLDAELTGFLS